MRHFLNPMDFSKEEWDKLLNLAEDIKKDPKKYAHVCDGKKIATLFYEASTRTRMSFESAMLNWVVRFWASILRNPALYLRVKV